VIIDAMNNHEWERRLPAIREAKHRLLTEMNPMNTVWEALHS
jgi:hypothetical protein